MRAPPEVGHHDQRLAAHPCAIHGAGNRLAHHGSHRSADKAVLHRAHHHRVRPHLPHRIHNRVVQPRGLLRLAQPLLVGLHVGKIQRVGRAQTHVHQLIARLQQQLDPLPRAELEMMLALRAHIQVRFQIRPADRLPAARALDPQTLGANALLARIRAPFSGPGPDSYSPFSRLNQDIPNPIVNGLPNQRAVFFLSNPGNDRHYLALPWKYRSDPGIKTQCRAAPGCPSRRHVSLRASPSPYRPAPPAAGARCARSESHAPSPAVPRRASATTAGSSIL